MAALDNTAENTEQHSVSPTVIQALIPVGVLISLLSLAVYMFGGDNIYGPHQKARCVGAAVACL
ncbi:MAG: hypothetical protein VXZ69_01165, partial [Pseudomonadota bacterium]|nr:hypothetical protein [Pseudomonadota bacterium]